MTPLDKVTAFTCSQSASAEDYSAKASVGGSTPGLGVVVTVIKRGERAKPETSVNESNSHRDLERG
jgi:hypothetical protein